jgi:isopentenyl-diphosphate delta-isomerase
MQREQRKLDHIKYALELGDGTSVTHFADLRFVHNCLPELNPADIDISVRLLGKRLRLPFFIDAITGSTDAVTEINRRLAQVAAVTGVGMAVGSQYGAVVAGSGVVSYEAVRRENPYGLLMGNMSAFVTPAQAESAVAMLDADALELHLNAAQELQMPEGDKEYAGLLCNIRAIFKQLSVPLIVKETGCGIAREQYEQLEAAGIMAFDCAGAGGTNFPAIEARRSGVRLSDAFASWGLPTCWSLLDGQAVVPRKHLLLASGGVRSADDVAKAFALGADAVGITAPLLRLVVEEDVGAAIAYLEKLGAELKHYLLLLGCSSVYGLRGVPLLFFGETRDYLASRGYDAAELSRARRTR